jgi:MerR family transcriptional regulator/heat shock protein HspR
MDDEQTGRRNRSGPPGEDDDRGVYIISVAAELVGVHPQTLRIYERKGLLSPHRTSGNTRRYSASDIARLQMIQHLTQEGVNLAGVKMIVEMENELDRMRERVDGMRAEMERAEARVRLEVDRVRREFRGEIVPVSELSRLQRRLQAEAASRQQEPGRRRGPIALGPVSRGRGPAAMSPDS